MAYLGHNPKGYPHPFKQPTIIFRLKAQTLMVHGDDRRSEQAREQHSIGIQK